MVTMMKSPPPEQHVGEPAWVRAIDAITRVGAIIVGIATLALLVLIALNVVLRNTISSPVPGAMSLIIYWCMPMIGIMGLGYVHLQNEQIVMTLLAENASERALKRLSVIVEIVVAALLVVLVLFTWSAAMQDFSLRLVDNTEPWLPIWPGRFVLLLGLVISLLAVLARIYRIIAGTTDLVPDEMKEALE